MLNYSVFSSQRWRPAGKRYFCTFVSVGKEILDLWAKVDFDALWMVWNGFHVTCTGDLDVQLVGLGFAFSLSLPCWVPLFLPIPMVHTALPFTS